MKKKELPLSDDIFEASRRAHEKRARIAVSQKRKQWLADNIVSIVAVLIAGASLIVSIIALTASMQ